MGKSISKKRKIVDPSGNEEIIITENFNGDSTRSYQGDNHHVLIELIKMNETNNNIKLDNLAEKIDSLVSYHKDETDKMRNELKEMKDDFTTSAVKPLREMISKHESALDDIKKEQAIFVKREQFCKMETDLKDNIKIYEKRMLWFNISFLLLYAYILFSSDVSISWKSIFSFLKVIF